MKADIVVVKWKKGKPSVIMVNGDRYVLDPNTAKKGEKK